MGAEHVEGGIRGGGGASVIVRKRKVSGVLKRSNLSFERHLASPNPLVELIVSSTLTNN